MPDVVIGATTKANALSWADVCNKCLKIRCGQNAIYESAVQ